MSPEEEVIRGGSAAEILDSELFNEAKRRVIDGIHAKMAIVPLADTAMHTKLIMLLQSWNSLESYLNTVKETGRLAGFQIEDEKKRFRLFG